MTEKNTTSYTPMMQQYLKIKEDYADAIVFFRLGDFYEMFFDDAIIASKVLEIALTSRDAGNKVPMCGVPHHAMRPYVQKLVEKGFKIAVAEQVTEPGKGLVERKVVRLITPGTIFESDILKESENNYIASLTFIETGFQLTYVDISTGEAYLSDGLNKKQVLDLIESLKIREVILAKKMDDDIMAYFADHEVSHTIFNKISGHDNKLTKHLPALNKRGADHLLSYLEATQYQTFNHFKPFEIVKLQHFMNVDFRVKKHLEILESQTNNPQTTLLKQLDQTETAMGARKLRHILNYPLVDKALIEERLEYIESFLKHSQKEAIKDSLKYIYDINRIVSRVGYSSANAKDLEQLKDTLLQIPSLKAFLLKDEDPIIHKLANDLDAHEDLAHLLERSITLNPPLTIKEGGIIKDGYHEQLDHYRMLSRSGEEWLKTFEEEERERTGIKTLKIGYNRVFGYYIEVSKGAMHLVLEEHGYERKQTLANSERYISDVLKKKEDDLLHAKEKSVALEYEIFKEIRDVVESYTHSLQVLSSKIADIDYYLSCAFVSRKNQYVRPTFNGSEVIVKNGRHPVVEHFTKFIENDVIMKPGEVFLITGPNMSGKSTYMRMYALIVYLAQIGMFVPAKEANLKIYDGLFTRIGSSDDLAGGKSTFMVEMVESNEALMNATKDSLIMFDEIGRGTATYDGMALAQAMIEYIHEVIQAQTMFSTHYHELTALEQTLKRLKNLHVKAREEKNKMVFLHQIEEGPTDKSYGIQVASLANLPEVLIKRSKDILANLEKDKKRVVFDLFNYEEYKETSTINPISQAELNVLDMIEKIDINELTPIEALIQLKYLQEEIKKGK
ncbi:MAG TPA: DNA mismatch repair protein MutS [Acholeplasma sp.]|jgi:DNA mismatch repair protein MutS|nr:DNA mismatch repair protein MutS [Acholeplasma sp.]